jgi:VWFA-related protein
MPATKTFAVLVAILATASPILAGPPEFGSAITVVTVPVFATDRKGQAVTGLTADDFEMTDDGRPVKLVGLREIDAAELLPDQTRDSPAARRQFLLLFDLSFTNVNGLVRSRKAAREFVNRLAPSDLASVATFSANHGLRLLLAFTSDRSQLARAIETLGVLQLDRRADPLGLAYDLREVGAAMPDSLPEEGGSALADAMRAVQIRFERSQQALYRQKVLALFEGLGQLATALEAVQGRKQVVFLSGGFDGTTLGGQSTAQTLQDSDAVVRGRLWEVQSENRFGDTQVRDDMTRALRAFSAADAVVHSVDLSGLSARGDAAQGPGEGVRNSGQDSLAEIANLSGGRLFKDTNDIGRALAEISEMSRRYYLLAFEPPATRGAGRFHKLRVRLSRTRDVSLSHRAGYFERAAEREHTALSRRFEAAEVVAKGLPESELAVRVLGVPHRTPSGSAAFSFVVEVEPREASGAMPLGLEIYAYALDEKGAIEDFIAIASNLDLARVGDKLRGRGLRCRGAFVLPPGRHSLRVLARDSASGRMGSAWLELTLPAFDSPEVLLFPPLFMDDPAQWVVIDAPSRGAHPPESPFRVADEEFVPRVRPSLANGRLDRVCLLVFDGGRSYDPGASFEIKPQLVKNDGGAVRLGRIEVAKTVSGTDGFRRFVLNVTPADLVAGDYTLRVRLRDPSSGRVSEAYQAVRVE